MYVIEVTAYARWVGDGANQMSVPSAQSLLVPPVTVPTTNARPITCSTTIPDQTSQANLDTQLSAAATALGTALGAAFVANNTDGIMYSWQSGGPAT